MYQHQEKARWTRYLRGPCSSKCRARKCLYSCVSTAAPINVLEETYLILRFDLGREHHSFKALFQLWDVACDGHVLGDLAAGAQVLQSSSAARGERTLIVHAIHLRWTSLMTPTTRLGCNRKHRSKMSMLQGRLLAQL